MPAARCRGNKCRFVESSRRCSQTLGSGSGGRWRPGEAGQRRRQKAEATEERERERRSEWEGCAFGQATEGCLNVRVGPSIRGNGRWPYAGDHAARNGPGSAASAGCVSSGSLTGQSGLRRSSMAAQVLLQTTCTIVAKGIAVTIEIDADVLTIIFTSFKTLVVEIRAEATPIQLVAASSPDLARDLAGLLKSEVGVDVKFKVGRETFQAHRYILAARSPIFEAELFGQMREKKVAQIQIEDMEPKVFEAMLHFIYTDSLPEIDDGEGRVMAQHLLVAADRYGLQRLKSISEETLCKFVDINTTATTLALAEQHGCHQLKEACIKFLKSPGNMKAVMTTDGYEHLMTSCPFLRDELLEKVAP
ncbi:hypothetical protein PR202_ga22522 [Eleusine coracana subsp. coracana]|uniref:BTB domain-containing protein n=1 Tax=Eleusine coracana subsp. coracana TaxID=191504 RepID=A0AAV5D3J0_ELECO|nr:hypothetical protein PR202_ga22522 [Eleusine coracana subsp. coracana]